MIPGLFNDDILSSCVIQGDSEREIYILEGDIMGHCEKNIRMDMCLILNGYRNRATNISRPNSVRLLFVGLDDERILRRKCGYTRRIAGWHFGCCFPHKET